MDTSPEYIMMCEKAKEIQENWLPIFGDIITPADHCLRRKRTKKNVYTQVVWRYGDDKRGIPAKTSIIVSLEKIGARDRKHRSDKVWLPRQDQLQEIARQDSDGYECIHTLLNRFNTFQMNYIRLHTYVSAEQLWLAFVMKEKHNKVWNGKDWEVDKK